MGEKWPIQFCLQRATSTVSVGIFYMSQIYDMEQTALLLLRRKADFSFQVFKKLFGKFLISLVPAEDTSYAILLHLITVALFAEQSILRDFI
jgi:hypothetical protein